MAKIAEAGRSERKTLNAQCINQIGIYENDNIPIRHISISKNAVFLICSAFAPPKVSPPRLHNFKTGNIPNMVAVTLCPVAVRLAL
ncbi:MAG TPA: hypothetical protein VKB88_26550 [Bryobacteraceae bacterium]|nr:hypothetical protein [Bryobacteraceae bacterium]